MHPLSKPYPPAVSQAGQEEEELEQEQGQQLNESGKKAQTQTHNPKRNKQSKHDFAQKLYGSVRFSSQTNFSSLGSCGRTSRFLHMDTLVKMAKTIGHV